MSPKNKKILIISAIALVVLVVIIIIAQKASKNKRKERDEKLDTLERELGQRGGGYDEAWRAIANIELSASDKQYSPRNDVEKIWNAMHGDKACEGGSWHETLWITSVFHGTCEEDIWDVLSKRTGGELKVLNESYEMRKGVSLRDEFLDEFDKSELKKATSQMWKAINRSNYSSYYGQISETPRPTGNPIYDQLLIQNALAYSKR